MIVHLSYFPEYKKILSIISQYSFYSMLIQIFHKFLFLNETFELKGGERIFLYSGKYL